MPNKNDVAWEQLFSQYDILDHVKKNGSFQITSDQINDYRESRLMTKFDHINNLPILFKENDLSILPLTRGSYTIGKYKAYEKIEYSKSIKDKLVQFPENLESLDYSNLYSESAALNCAFVCNIMSDIANEAVVPTLSGRMSTGSFDFRINCDGTDQVISVAGSQCEIDAGYEGENSILIFEAKKQTVDDFLIRQLYYPYRTWFSRVRKKVIPIFLTHSSDTYSFFIYGFEDPDHYNSLQLIEQRNYIVTSRSITLTEIHKLLNEVKIIPDILGIPFPQADNFNRVIDIVGLLIDSEDGKLHKDTITSNYDFDERQSSYYGAAARYLGLANKERPGEYKFSPTGKKIFDLPYHEKYLEIVRLILQHEVFNRALHLYFEQFSPITIHQALEIMKTSAIYGISSEETYFRRAQTVIKWIDWIIELDRE